MKRRKGQYILILFFFLPIFFLYSENVKISEFIRVKEEYTKGIKCKVNKRDMTIMNYGSINYCFSYNYIDDNAFLKVNNNAKLPIIGDSTAGNTGIGLSPGWYNNGFLKITINGKSVFGNLANIKIVEADNYCKLYFLWEFMGRTVSAVFVAMVNDDRIYCRVRLDAKEDLKSFHVGFLALPGHYGYNSALDRWCSTFQHNWRNLTDGPQKKKLDAKNENWLIFYDAQNNKPLGTAAMFFDPEQIQSGDIFVESMTAGVDLVVKPGISQADFVIWGFPDEYKTPEEAYDYLSRNSGKILTELRNFKF